MSAELTDEATIEAENTSREHVLGDSCWCNPIVEHIPSKRCRQLGNGRCSASYEVVCADCGTPMVPDECCGGHLCPVCDVNHKDPWLEPAADPERSNR